MAQLVRAAARASLGRGDDDLLTRKIGGEVAAGGLFAGEGLNRGSFGSRDLAKQLGLAGIGLELFEGQLELIEQVPATLGARAIFVTAHLLIHQFKMGVAGQQVGIDRPDFSNLGLGHQCLVPSLLGLLACQGQLGTKMQKLIGGIAGDHAVLYPQSTLKPSIYRHFLD